MSTEPNSAWYFSTLRVEKTMRVIVRQDRMKRTTSHTACTLFIVILAITLISVWGCRRFQVPGHYSLRSYGCEPLCSSSVMRLTLDRKGTGVLWKNNGTSFDFSAHVSWVEINGTVEVTIAPYSYCNMANTYFQPGVHRFRKQMTQLEAIGSIEYGVFNFYGIKEHMGPKVFTFRKDIFQL